MNSVTYSTLPSYHLILPSPLLLPPEPLYKGETVKGKQSKYGSLVSKKEDVSFFNFSLNSQLSPLKFKFSGVQCAVS